MLGRPPITRTFPLHVGSDRGPPRWMRAILSPRPLPTRPRLASARTGPSRARRAGRSGPLDRDQLQEVAAAAHGLLADLPDAGHVPLVVDHARLQPVELLGPQRVLRGPVRDPDRGFQADDLEAVLADTPGELLVEDLADPRPARHEDSRPGVVDPGLPRALRGEPAVLVFPGLLAEVPDGPVLVLGE